MSATAAPRARAGRRVWQGLVTLGITGLSAGLVVLGTGLIGRERGEAAQTRALPMPVATLRVEMVPGHAVTRRFAGRFEAAARADPGFEILGRLAAMTVGEGDAVARATVLARLDVAALLPQRAARVGTPFCRPPRLVVLALIVAVSAGLSAL